jgi:hypothetical protein
VGGIALSVARAGGGAGCRLVSAAFTSGTTAVEEDGRNSGEKTGGESSWPLTGAVVLGVLVGLCMLIYIGKMLFRLVAFGLCLLSGAAGVVLLAPWLREVLPEILPARIGAGSGHEVIAYAVAFLVGYLAALVLLGILVKPLRSPGKHG